MGDGFGGGTSPIGRWLCYNCEADDSKVIVACMLLVESRRGALGKRWLVTDGSRGIVAGVGISGRIGGRMEEPIEGQGFLLCSMFQRIFLVNDVSEGFFARITFGAVGWNRCSEHLCGQGHGRMGCHVNKATK
jgi:hypothetical protein